MGTWTLLENEIVRKWKTEALRNSNIFWMDEKYQQFIFQDVLNNSQQ